MRDVQSPSRAGRRNGAVKQWTASRFGYLWDKELSPETLAAYHYRLLKPLLPADHLRGRVLDAGCGAGVDMRHMVEDGARFVVGVELSRQGARQSRERVRSLPNAKLVQADLEALPFGPGCFDFVYSYGVLHHLPDPEQGFRELVRVLKPGGMVAAYVYEDFSTRSRLERWALRAVNGLRRLTVHLPGPLLYALCRFFSPVIYLVLTLPARGLSRWRATAALARRIPFRQGASPFNLAGDLYDRFSAPIERRYSRAQMETWLRSAGLTETGVAPHRGWLFYGTKPEGLPAARPAECEAEIA